MIKLQNPMIDIHFVLLLLCGLYHGPSYFAKNGLTDFGDFLVILLIQAKVNVMHDYTKYPDRLPIGSVKKLQTFLQIFPVLSENQQSILDQFIKDEDVDGYLCKYFGSDYERLIEKYEHHFRSILPTLFRNGLQISHNYYGSYACSTAKWIVVKTIYSILYMNTFQKQSNTEKQLSKTSQMVKFAVSILQNYRHNRVFMLYLGTMIHVERNRNSDCLKIADKEYRDIVISDYSHYEDWLKLHSELKTILDYSFPIHPKDWDEKLISWIMNSLQNYGYLRKYLAEIQ